MVKRRWRHLDTCQYSTFIEAEVPRVECKEHGIHSVGVPWAERKSRFTILFERLVIDLLHDAPTSVVAEYPSDEDMCFFRHSTSARLAGSIREFYPDRRGVVSERQATM